MFARLFSSPSGSTLIDQGNGRPPRPLPGDLAGLLKYTASHKEGFFQFHNLRSHFISKQNEVDNIRAQAKKELDDEITWLEEAARRHKHPQLYLAAATVADLYASGFSQISRGEDKRPAYERVLRIYEEYTAAFPNDPTSLLKAAQIRVGVPQMRDSVQARLYLDRVRRIAPLSAQHREKLDRLEDALKPPPPKPPRSTTPKPVPTLPLVFDYDTHYWPPDERVRCRAICRYAKKVKDMNLLHLALVHLYRVAVLEDVYTFISYVTTERNDDRLKHHYKSNKQKLLALSYAENGKLKPYLKDKPFLSETDYKFFELAWGPAKKTCDPIKEIDLREVAR